MTSEEVRRLPSCFFFGGIRCKSPFWSFFWKVMVGMDSMDDMDRSISEKEGGVDEVEGREGMNEMDGGREWKVTDWREERLIFFLYLRLYFIARLSRSVSFAADLNMVAWMVLQGLLVLWILWPFLPFCFFPFSLPHLDFVNIFHTYFGFLSPKTWIQIFFILINLLFVPKAPKAPKT